MSAHTNNRISCSIQADIALEHLIVLFLFSFGVGVVAPISSGFFDVGSASTTGCHRILALREIC